MTIITTTLKGATHGMTANAFMSVSLQPPLIIVAVDNMATMNRMLLVGRNFGVSVLAEEQISLSNHFAGKPVEGLAIEFVRPTGTPVIEGALAHLIASVVQIHPAGDHMLYIGEVEYVAWQDTSPLLFYSGQYRQMKPEAKPRDIRTEDEMSLFSIASFDVPTS